MIDRMMLAELNDDVVMEILARLPAESLCRFKSVSRLWRDFISSSTFIQRHAAAHRHDGGGNLVGFLQEAAVHETSETLTAKHCNTLTLTLTSCCKGEGEGEGEGEGAGLKLKIPRHVGNFINSSNGLILCSRIRGSLVTYHVGNPLTGKFVELPPPPHGKYCLTIESDAYGRYGRMYSEGSGMKPPLCSAGLICDTKPNSNSTICNYSVVRASTYVSRTGDKRNIVYFDSYSSETGKWSPMTELVATGFVYMARLTQTNAAPPLVANGIVHWCAKLGKIALYDPKAGDTHVQLIDLPKNYDSYAITRSTDDDVLCLGLVRAQNIMFYTLPKTTKINGGGGYKRQDNIDSNEWVLMRDVSIPTLCSSKRRGRRRSTAAGLVACKKTTLEFLIPGTTALEVVALLRQENKVFLYNLQNNTIQNLDYCGRINQHNKLAPYFRSSSLTSYCL